MVREWIFFFFLVTALHDTGKRGCQLVNKLGKYLEFRPGPGPVPPINLTSPPFRSPTTTGVHGTLDKEWEEEGTRALTTPSPTHPPSPQLQPRLGKSDPKGPGTQSTCHDGSRVVHPLTFFECPTSTQRRYPTSS